MCKQSDVQIGGRPPAELMNRLIRHGRGRVLDLFIQMPSPKKHARKGWEWQGGLVRRGPGCVSARAPCSTEDSPK